MQNLPPFDNKRGPLPEQGKTVRAFLPFNRVKYIALLLFLAQSLVPFAQEWEQFGSDLTGDGLDAFGTSVAYSGDGMIMAIGATLKLHPDETYSDPFDFFGGGVLPVQCGAVIIYEWVETAWMERQTLYGETNLEAFGTSVSLSSDGSILAVGAPAYNVTDDPFALGTGRAQIFERNGNEWIQKGSDITDISDGASVGAAVAISDNGTTVAVGLPGINGSGLARGAIRVYRFDTNWTQIGSDIEGTDDYNNFGGRLALSSDGTILAGASILDLDGNNAGYVKVLKNNGGTWIQRGETLENTDFEGNIINNSWFGYALGVSDDGNRLAVSAPGDFIFTDNAKVFVYDYDESGWSTDPSEIITDIVGDNFGNALGLSGDGTTLIIGAPNGVTGNEKGRVEIWKDESSWSQIGSDLLGKTDFESFGAAVGISGDGNRIAAGSSIESRVETYEIAQVDETPPTVEITSTASDPTNQSLFEVSVTFSEPINGFEASDLVVSQGDATIISGVDGDSEFTVSISPQAGEEFSDGEITVVLEAGMVQDLAGNDNLASETFSLTYDGTDPNTQLFPIDEQNNPLVPDEDGTFRVNGPFKLLIRFQDDISNPFNFNGDAIQESEFTLSDILIENGALSALMDFTINEDITNTWEVTVTPSDQLMSEQAITVSIAAGEVFDLAGNPNMEGSISVTYDDQAPVVTVNPVTSNDQRPELTGTVDDPDAQIVVTVDGGDYMAVTNNDITWTLQDNSIASELAEGTYDVSVTATDLAGNQGIDNTANELTIDITPAEISRLYYAQDETENIPDPVYVNGNIFYMSFDNTDGTSFIQLTGGDGLNGPDTYDIQKMEITIGDVDFTPSVVSVKIGDAFLDFISFVPPAGQSGDMTITIEPGFLTDAAGNQNVESYTEMIRFDAIVPAAEDLFATDANGGVITAINSEVDGFKLAFVVNKEIDTFNGLQITGASVNGEPFITTNPFLEGLFIYTFDIAEIADGIDEISIGLDAAALVDSVGNVSEAVAPLVISIDNIAPVPTINVQENVNNTDQFEVEIVFSEGVKDFAIDNLDINGESLDIPPTFSSINADGSSFKFDMSTDSQGTGTISISLVEGAALDSAGNKSIATSEDVLVDFAPTVSLSTDKVFVNENDFPIAIKITWSEEVTAFYKDSIDINNGTIVSELITNDNVIFEGLINPVEGLTNNEKISAQVNKKKAQDIDGTPFYNGVSSNLLSITIDNISPEFQVMGVPIEPVPKAEFSVNIIEEGIGFTEDNILVENNAAVVMVSGEGPHYDVILTPVEGTTDNSVINFEIIVEDLASNKANYTSSFTYIQKYSGGCGTEQDPYLIGTKEDVLELSSSSSDWDAHFVQIQDISFNKEDFITDGSYRTDIEAFRPIGNHIDFFSGTYDGQDFLIKNFTINEQLDLVNYGFFGVCSNAKIKNLGLQYSSFSLVISDADSRSYSGGLIGHAINSEILDCFVIGKISTITGATGGLVGLSQGCSIARSYTSLRMTGTTHKAAFVFRSENTVISECFSTGSNSSFGDTHGFVGFDDGGTILDCYSTVDLFNPFASFFSFTAFGIGIVNDTRISNFFSTGSIPSANAFSNNVGLIRVEEDSDHEISGVLHNTETTGWREGETTENMMKQITYTNAGWDFVGESSNGTEEIWLHEGNYPVLNWQKENTRNISVSGLVQDKDGEPFKEGTVVLTNDLDSLTTTLDENGEFIFENVPPAIYSLGVWPKGASSSIYKETYLDKKTFAFKSLSSVVAYTHLAGELVKMIPGNASVVVNTLNGDGSSRMVVNEAVEEVESVAGILITLKDEQGNVVAEGYTDEDGSLTFYNLVEGNYTVSMTLPDIGLVSAPITTAEESQTSVTGIIGSSELEVSDPVPTLVYSWTGVEDTNWGNVNNWDLNAIPKQNDHVIITAAGFDAEVGEGVEAYSYDLTINENASLNVAGGGSLAIFGTATNNGTYTVQKTVTGGDGSVNSGGYSMLSTPVFGTALTELDEADLAFAYNNGSDSYVSLDDESFMSRGEGYFVAHDEVDPMVTFTGTPNSGSITYEVSADDISEGATDYELVGNPYAAAIDAEAFLEGNAITSAVYIWDDGGINTGGERLGDYIAMNAIGAVAVSPSGQAEDNGFNGNTSAADDGYIASVQGFFVDVSEGGFITFNPEMQVRADGSNDASDHYRVSTGNSSDEPDRLTLALNGQGLYNEILIGLDEKATVGEDRMLDAKKFSGNSKISFYSYIEEEQYAIQGIPLDAENVSLGYDLANEGVYEVEVVGLLGFEGVDVTLVDHYSGSTYNLKEITSIPFAISEAVMNDQRFELVFSPGEAEESEEVLSVEYELSPQLSVYGSNSLLNIVYSSSERERILIYDLSGKVAYRGSHRFVNNEVQLAVNLGNDHVYVLLVDNQLIKFILRD